MGGVDVSGAIGDFFGAGNLESLALLDGLDESCRFEERVVRAGVEPGHAASHELGMEVSKLKIAAVEVGDLEFVARGRLERAREVDDAVVIEVEAGDGEARLGLLWFFFEAKGATIAVHFNDTVALGVVNGIGKDGGPAVALGCGLHHVGEVVSVKDVVAEDEGATLAGDEVGPDEEGLRDAFGARLHGVAEAESPAGAVAEKLLEARRVLRRRDD